MRGCMSSRYHALMMRSHILAMRRYALMTRSRMLMMRRYMLVMSSVGSARHSSRFIVPLS